MTGQYGPEVEGDVAVSMSRYKVDRGLGALSEGGEVLDPSRRRGGRPSDPQTRFYLLYGLPPPLQLEVLGLGAGPKNAAGSARSDLEAPLRHFAGAVAVDDMFGQLGVQVSPESPSPEAGDAAAVLRTQWRPGSWPVVGA